MHPRDLREARGLFLRMLLIQVVTSPSIALCVAGLVWFATQSYLASLIAGGVLITIGILVGHHLSECPWEYIPRGRQDRGRPLPVVSQANPGADTSRRVKHVEGRVEFGFSDRWYELNLNKGGQTLRPSAHLGRIRLRRHPTTPARGCGARTGPKVRARAGCDSSASPRTTRSHVAAPIGAESADRGG